MTPSPTPSAEAAANDLRCPACDHLAHFSQFGSGVCCINKDCVIAYAWSDEAVWRKAPKLCLRSERDQALAKLAEVEKERDALRKSFIYAINHAGGKVSDECSTEFLCMGADQIKLYCDKQRSAYATVKGEQMELIQTRAGYLAERDEARRERDTALSRLSQSDALLREAQNHLDEPAILGPSSLDERISAHLATATTKEGKT